MHFGCKLLNHWFLSPIIGIGIELCKLNMVFITSAGHTKTSEGKCFIFNREMLLPDGLIIESNTYGHIIINK